MVNTAHQADPIKRKRLRWRARRGLLENDLIMTRFLDLHEEALSDSEVAALSVLLDLPDNDLMDLILARKQIDAQIDSPDVRRVVTLLQAA